MAYLLRVLIILLLINGLFINNRLINYLTTVFYSEN